MAVNTFLPTTFTATTDAQKLSDLLSAVDYDIGTAIAGEHSCYAVRRMRQIRVTVPFCEEVP